MLTTTAIFAFSFIISNTYAECPRNPKQQAKECGDIFTQFAQKADESTEALLRHCPEVYEALDCLRDIFNDCEMYQNLGLKMTDKQYDQMKKPLDNVCNTRRPLVVDKDEVNKVLVQIGLVSYRVIFLADFMSPDSEGPDGLPDSTESDEFPDLSTSQIDELPNSNETDTEESDFTPNQQCVQELMACNEIGRGISGGLSFPEMCKKMSDMADCLDELKEGECGSTLPPEATANLGMARNQYNQICTGQPPTATKKKRRISNMQETMCMMDAESCYEHLHSFTLSHNVCGSVKNYLNCYIRLDGCHSLLPSLYNNKYLDAQSKYNKVCTGQKCAEATKQCYTLKENINHDEPNSIRCPKVVEIVRCAFRQYACGSPYDIFFGDFMFQVNNMLSRCNYQNAPRKRNIPSDSEVKRNVPGLSADEKRCSDLADECSKQVLQLQPGEYICVGMARFISCIENVTEQCEDFSPVGVSLAENLNKSRNDYNKMCGHRNDKTVVGCVSEGERCKAILNSIDIDSPTAVRCPKVMEVLLCFQRLFSDCSVVLSNVVGEVSQFIGQCHDEGWRSDTNYQNAPMKRNVPGLSEDDQRCSDLVDECKEHVLKRYPGKDLCVAMGRFLRCVETVNEQCEDFSQGGVSLGEKLNKSRNDYNKVCGQRNNGKRSVSTRGLDNFRCVLYFERCERRYGQKSFDKIHEITDCHVLDQNIRCNDEGIDICRDILPDYDNAKQEIAKARAMYNARCGDTEEVEERSVSTKDMSSECTAMSQECVAMVGRFKFSGDLSVLCGDLREMISCMENLVNYCSSVLPNIGTIRGQIARSKSQVGTLCKMQLPGGTLPTPTGQQAECVNLVQSCTAQFSSIDYNNDLEETCNGLRSIVGCFKNVLKKCRRILPNAAQIERNMDQAQRQVSNTCGSTPDTSESMVTSSSSNGGVTLMECGNMNKKCVGYISTLDQNQNPQAVCRILNTTVDCFDVVIAKCGDILPNIAQIDSMMVQARKQVSLACNEGESIPDTTEDCQVMLVDCMKGMEDFSIGPNQEESCRDFQNIKSCFDNMVARCGSMQGQIGMYMTGLEKQIAQICGGIDFESETAMTSKPVQGGTKQMECFKEFQRCSTESNIISDSDCEGIMSTVECIRNVTNDCPGVFPPAALEHVKRIETMAGNCSNTTDEIEEEEEVDSAWCASKAQSCLNMISSFSVKSGMEATCSSLHTMVNCFDEVIDKCQSSIADLEKNSGQLFAMKENIESACRKGGTGLVITPNSNHEKCMSKYKKCAGLMAKVPLHEDNKVMCPSLRRSMACIKKVTLECSSLLPESAKQQFSNFENLNKICPVGSYKNSKSRSKFTEKCSNDIKVCDDKANGIMNGDNINKTDCRDGFRTLTCYRQVARECRLPKSNRKFFKHFKTILTDTCERRSTVRHTRGQIDFDIDWPWEDQVWPNDFEGYNSIEDTFLFGDDDFEFEKDF